LGEFQSADIFTDHRTNALFTFQGKPTVFGTSLCDLCDEDSTNLKQVRQYQPDENDWKTIGYLDESRKWHEVIEVPKAFCYLVK